MGLFETMRENTKVILWITVIAIVGLNFLARGADFATRGGRGKDDPGVLGRVNGDPIYAREFSQAFEAARVNYEEQAGQPADEAALVMISASTWDQMVDGILMGQLAKKYDLLVTDEEVANALLYVPLPRFRTLAAFQNDQGQFDPQRYQTWVTDPRTNTLPLEQEYRRLLLVQKLRLLAFSAVKVSGEEVRQAWLNKNRKVDIGYAQVPYYRVRSEEKIEDATLEEYLRTHTDEFLAPPQVVLEYVRLEKRPTAEDSLEARNQMAEVLREIDRGESFQPLVQSYSEATKDRWGGEGGRYFTREQLSPPALAEAAFALPVGGVSGVIQSPQGLHLIQAEDRRTTEGRDEVKIAEILIPIKMSYETNYALQDHMLDLVDSTGTMNFRDAAAAADLPLKTTGAFDPKGVAPGLGRVAAAKDFALTAAVGKTSRPVETVDAWYVFHLAERREAAVPPLEEIRRGVRNAYLREQRKEAATAVAQRVLDRARAGVALEQATSLESLAVFNRVEGVIAHGQVRGLGYDPTLNVALFRSTQAGLLPEVIAGNQAAFVVEILSPPYHDEAALQAAQQQLRQQMLEERQTQAATEWMERMRAEAEIEDHRQVVSSM
jgi:peptidyl-prolyl cis-trans isomerase D